MSVENFDLFCSLVIKIDTQEKKVFHSTLAKQVRSRSLSGIPWKVTDFKFSVTLKHSFIVLHNCDRNMLLID